MKSGVNRLGRPITIKQVASALRVSYEHLRGLYHGTKTSISNDLNVALCEMLGLDPAKMWAIAEREKLKAKFPRGAALATIPEPKFVRVWSELGDEDRRCVIRIAESLAFRAAARRLSND
jgi:hypothetical protein